MKAEKKVCGEIYYALMKRKYQALLRKSEILAKSRFDEAKLNLKLTLKLSVHIDIS